ncbi:MAG: guanylate kinase [Gemmatimonadales bacterium]|nr:MAG: guanylate kinase [Gemmatimonadales bacterium]
MTPFLLVLSSPSGGGKTTIARALLQARSDVGYSVSATTRAPRSGERDGLDYHFLSAPEFERRVAAGEFLEHATYGGNRYGTLRSEIDRVLGGGRHAVLDIEVEGARQVMERMPNAVRVFVLPPSAKVLVERLRGRDTETPEARRIRLARAAEELLAVTEYDYVVINEHLRDAVNEVAAILDAESSRVARRRDLTGFVEILRQGVAAAAHGESV